MGILRRVVRVALHRAERGERGGRGARGAGDVARSRRVLSGARPGTVERRSPHLPDRGLPDLRQTGSGRTDVGRLYRRRGGRRRGSAGPSAQSWRAAVAGVLHRRAKPGRAPGGSGADLLRRFVCQADRADPAERGQQEKPGNGGPDGRALDAGGAQYGRQLSSAAGVGCAAGRTARPRFFGGLHGWKEAGQLRLVLRPQHARTDYDRQVEYARQRVVLRRVDQLRGEVVPKPSEHTRPNAGRVSH